MSAIPPADPPPSGPSGTDDLDDQMKVAYERAVARLAEQRTDLTILQSRAKDILGLAVLAAGVGKLLASEPYLNRDSVLAYLVLLAFLVLAGAVVYVLKPRTVWVWGWDPKIAADNSMDGLFKGKADFYSHAVEDLSGYDTANEVELQRVNKGVHVALAAFVIQSLLILSAAFLAPASVQTDAGDPACPCVSGSQPAATNEATTSSPTGSTGPDDTGP